VKEFPLKESENESAENFEHRPRKPGGWKEDQLPMGEDYVFLESDLGSDNCRRLIVVVVVWWSEFLAANPGVPSSIPCSTRFSE
jgi:hypothetical protein